MKISIIHTISWMACLLLLLACDNQEDPLPDDSTHAYLFLNVSTIGQTKVGMDEVLPPNELMHSLRVVVLHEDGTVEHNQHYDLSGPSKEYEIIPLQVTPNEAKKIFLFANEESIDKINGGNRSLTNFFEDYSDNAEGFESAVNALYFAPDYTATTNIPMSSVYEIKKEEIPAQGTVKKTFYLVRAMTKFTFTFQNGRTDGPITVNQMEVSAFADKMYLMPHLYNDEGAVTSESFTVVDNKKETDNGGNIIAYEPVYKDADGYNGTYKSDGTFWIDWLEQAVDWSQDETAGYTADQIGWIHQYNVPSDATYNNANTKIQLTGDFPVNMGEEYEYPMAFYRCESSHVVGSDQEYKVDYLKVTDGTGTVKEWTTDGSKYPGADETPALKLTNVRYLFRHTHVKVDIKFGQKEVAIFARIHPWKRSDPTDPRPLEPID